jgi:hypothetical protein
MYIYITYIIYIYIYIIHEKRVYIHTYTYVYVHIHTYIHTPRDPGTKRARYIDQEELRRGVEQLKLGICTEIYIFIRRYTHTIHADTGTKTKTGTSIKKSSAGV